MSEVPITLGSILSGPPEYGANAAALPPDGLRPRYLRITDIDDAGRLLHDDVRSIPTAVAEPYLLQTNDIVIARTGNTVGKSYRHEQSRGPLAFAGYLIRFRIDPKKADPKFVFHFLHSPSYQAWIGRTIRTGAQPNINAAEYKRLELTPFSPNEQRRISEILSTLDETIEQTDALIAKYQQVKAGLMHDLFTRGVTSDGRLRPTRAQAPDLYEESPLGWIPKEWYTKTLKELSHFITSGSRGWAEYYSETGPLFLRIGNLTRDHINFQWDSIARVSLPKFTEGQRTAVIPNDILISITADLGIVAVAAEGLGEAYVNQHIALVRPRFGRDFSRFVGRQISTDRGQRQLLRMNDSGAKAGLNLPAVGRIVLSVPSNQAEAAKITEILDLADESIDTQSRNAAKLRQQKQGLMHDLLTGRVPVKVTESEEVPA